MSGNSYRGAAERERRRVEEIIRRDRADEGKDAARKMAELEVREGVFVNLSDTVIEPTPEWTEKGDVQGYTPRQAEGTVRVVRTVRRVGTPVVARLHRAGKITDAQYQACVWYREMHEIAGLEGRYKSASLNSTGGGSSRNAAFAGHIAMTEEEAHARQMFRAARDSVTGFYLALLDGVVLDDVPLRRAARLAKCRTARVTYRFCGVAQELVEFCDSAEVAIGDDDEI